MRFFKYPVYTILTSIVLLLLYLALAYILTLFPLRGHSSAHTKSETIYLYHDEMHSNIILDITKIQHPWQKLLPQLLKNRKRGYLSFGWGDSETYLNTPTWDDLKVSTALKALFINTPSLMHVHYYRGIRKGKNIKPIQVTKPQYHEIEKKILKSFGASPTYQQKGYGYHDAFYHSPDQYNIINTCNTWTGDILRESNVTMSYWTPLSVNVVDSLP